MSRASTSTRRPRRRWLQYGLRTALLVTLLAALFFGWLARQKGRALNLPEALKKIGELGGHYTIVEGERDWLGKLLGEKPPELVDVAFGPSPPPSSLRPLALPASTALPKKPTSQEFAFLAQIRGLRKLKLMGFLQFDAGACDHLRELPHLSELEVKGTSVTDDGLRRLDRPARLTTLRIVDGDITAASLDILARWPALTELSIQWRQQQGAPVVVSGFPRLTNLTAEGAVPWLELAKTGGRISFVDLPALETLRASVESHAAIEIRNLPALKDCRLHYCLGEIRLASLPALQSLACVESLRNTPWKNDAVHLCPLPRLKVLNIWGVDVRNLSAASQSAVEQLMVRNCDVEIVGRSTFPALKSLLLSDCRLAPDELRLLLASPQLTSLTIAYRQDFDCAPLAACAAVDELRLDSLTIGDGDLAVIAKMPKLRSLDLDGTSGIGAAGVRHLAAAPNLQKLRIAFGKLGPEHAEALRQLASVTEIVVHKPHVTAPTREALRTIPNVQIEE
jgi:hypothetical protein